MIEHIISGIVAVASIVSPANAQFQSGIYQDDIWEVKVEFINGSHSYIGTNWHSGNAIHLRGATVSAGNYTWDNAGTRYRVRWIDSNTINLQVIDGRGSTILNRTLYRVDFYQN